MIAAPNPPTAAIPMGVFRNSTIPLDPELLGDPPDSEFPLVLVETMRPVVAARDDSVFVC